LRTAAARATGPAGAARSAAVLPARRADGGRRSLGARAAARSPGARGSCPCPSPRRQPGQVRQRGRPMTAPAPAPYAYAPHNSSIPVETTHLGHALKSEWTKIRTVRSTVWTLGVMLAL